MPGATDTNTCEDCPMAISLLVASEIVNENPHKNPYRAIGGIALTKNILEKTAGITECNGAASNSYAEQVCPLQGIVLNARNMASAPWPEHSFEINLGEIGANETSDGSEEGNANSDGLKLNNFGQYL